MSERILGFRLGGLGDLLVSGPSLKLVRESFGRAPFTLVCREIYGRFLEAGGLVDSVVPDDSGFLSGLFQEDPQTGSELHDWLKAFHTVWVWTSGPSGMRICRGLAQQGAGDIRLIGPPPSSLSVPLYEYFFRCTAGSLGREDLSVSGEGSLCLLNPGGPARSGRRPADRVEVVIHPGSGGQAKCWPLQRFLALADRLAAGGQGGVLVTGEAEGRMEPSIEGHVFPRGWSWLKRPTLDVLAERLRSCRFYLGNDSGVTHLAAACGVEVLAIFRREHEVAWRPCGRVKILSGEDVDEVGIEDVWSEVRRSLDCT